MALCNVGLLCCVYFSKTDFKKKTKTEAKFGPLSTTKYHWVTHTQTHVHIDGLLSDENGTKAPCATDFIVYPR